MVVCPLYTVELYIQLEERWMATLFDGHWEECRGELIHDAQREVEASARFFVQIASNAVLAHLPTALLT